MIRAAVCVLAAAASVRSSELQAEIAEILELSPVQIGMPVPTGWLSAGQLLAADLPVWAAGAAAATLSATQALGVADAGRVASAVRRQCDPDLAVHACALRSEAEGCNVTGSATEDKNRFLDLRVYSSPAAAGVRVVVAEDAARAVNRPLSFNVVIDETVVAGQNASGPLVGRNLSPAAAARGMDAMRPRWANGSLVRAVVAITEQWPWEACMPRLRSSPTRGADLDFETAVRSALERVVGAGFSVGFGELVRSSEGVVFTVSYALCGHWMAMPVTVQLKAS